MQYRKSLFVALVLAVVFADADITKLRISDFRVPRSKAYGLFMYIRLEGYSYYFTDDLTYGLSLAPFFHSFNDTTEFTLNSRLTGYRNSLDAIDSYVSAEMRHYVHSPLFLHGKAGLSASYRKYPDTQYASWLSDVLGGFEVGGGIGYLREGYAVARAIHVNEMLQREKMIEFDLAPETILRIAEVISTREFFRMKYARYLKYFFDEIEKILLSDPACTEPLSAYMWFKIYEILSETTYLSSPGYNYWLRMFGSRLSIDFIADGINRYAGAVYDYTRLGFPVGDTYYYTPGVRIRFERGGPIDLRRQFTLSSTYEARWYESVLHHRLEAQCRYGYGIIDFILLEGLLSAYYDYYVPRDTSSLSMYGFSPGLVFTYYMEDNISIGLNGGCCLRKAYNPAPDSGYDYSLDWFIDLSTRWRVF